MRRITWLAAAVLTIGQTLWAVEKAEYERLAKEVEASLERNVIRAWFPRCIDKENGGFHMNWGRDWTKQPSGNRFIVSQSRQVWIASQIAMRRPDLREEFLGYVRHGMKFLSESMWDKEHGGFYWGIELGKGTGKYGDQKHLYGEAFGIYAAAAAYEATKDPAALDLALRGFKWLEKNAHDARNGGYFECYTREGKVIEAQEPIMPHEVKFKGGGFFYGHKSMNAHIHILESLAQLYRASKDETVKQRLAEVLAVVRDKVAVEPGCLNLFFTYDWRPVPDHDSFGHDIETGFLITEAAEELGQPHDAKTLRMARMLVDHTYNFGWDKENGGFCERGFALEGPYDKSKVWWTQVEGLNALLLMHEQYGKETDRYWKAFLQQWQFVSKYQIDQEYPGLYETLEANGKPKAINKGHDWKAGYHDGRSLMLVGERLRKLAKE